MVSKSKFFNPYEIHFFQKPESVIEKFREIGVPPKRKITTCKVSQNAIIKPGNWDGVYVYTVFLLTLPGVSHSAVYLIGHAPALYLVQVQGKGWAAKRGDTSLPSSKKLLSALYMQDPVEYTSSLLTSINSVL